MEKILEGIKKEITGNKLFYIIIVIFILLNVITLDYYIFSPGSIIDLDSRIDIENKTEESGSFYLTYVTSRKGTLLNYLISYILPTWDREPLSNYQVEDESEKEIFARGKLDLESVSYDALEAAFKEAELNYTITKNDIAVYYVLKEAKTNLEVGDIIKKVAGHDISSSDEFNDIIKEHKIGDKLRVVVERNNVDTEAYVTVSEIEGEKKIGLYLLDMHELETTPKVEYIFKDSEAGSSRGLMCALEIYNRITKEDITKGRKIAGTGTISRDGVVGDISGVKYKLAGAVKNDCDIFIVPEGNYEEALKVKKDNNYKIEIIKASNLHDVIKVLNK